MVSGSAGNGPAQRPPMRCASGPASTGPASGGPASAGAASGAGGDCEGEPASAISPGKRPALPSPSCNRAAAPSGRAHAADACRRRFARSVRPATRRGHGRLAVAYRRAFQRPTYADKEALMAGRKKRPLGDFEHRDPITHTPGAHPLGVGAGAGAAGVAGAAIGGAVAGPVGAIVGATVGAFAGGLGGKAAAEAVNPTIEDEWWRDQYPPRPHAPPGG